MLMPARLARLPKTQLGYPALFFAVVIDGEPDIRRVSATKFHRCVNEKLCWLCGEPLDELVTFVVTKEMAKLGKWFEPPCHRECAEYAMAVCPFILNPDRRYRNGVRCPGDYELYTTSSYQCSPLRNSYPAGIMTLGPRVTS